MSTTQLVDKKTLILLSTIIIALILVIIFAIAPYLKGQVFMQDVPEDVTDEELMCTCFRPSEEETDTWEDCQNQGIDWDTCVAMYPVLSCWDQTCGGAPPPSQEQTIGIKRFWLKWGGMHGNR